MICSGRRACCFPFFSLRRRSTRSSPAGGGGLTRAGTSASSTAASRSGSARSAPGRNEARKPAIAGSRARSRLTVLTVILTLQQRPQHLLEGTDNIVLVLGGQAGGYGEQNASLEEAVGERAGALAVIALEIRVLRQVPGKAPAVHAGFVDEAEVVVIDVQPPVRHHNVRNALRRGHYSLGPERAVDTLGSWRVRVSGDQEAACVTLGVDDFSQLHLRKSLERFPDAVFAAPHVFDGRGQFPELDARDRGAQLIHAVALAPEPQVGTVEDHAAALVTRIAHVVASRSALLKPP